MFTHVKWIYHSGFAYIPLEDATAALQLHTVNGSWKKINRSETDMPVEEKIFMPVLLHGGLAKIRSFSYLLAYCKTVGEAKRLSRKPGFTIIRNDTACQAVSFKNGTIMAGFFRQGSVHFGSINITADRPCLALITGDRVFVSDPLHTGGVVNIQINNKHYQALLPAQGSSVRVAEIK